MAGLARGVKMEREIGYTEKGGFGVRGTLTLEGEGRERLDGTRQVE